MKTLRTTACLLAVLILLTVLPAAASGRVEVGVNQSLVMTNFNNVERVAVANPEIADIMVVSSSEVIVLGKAPGVTTLHVWSSSGRVSYQIEVGANDSVIAGYIKNVLGYPDVTVSKVDKTVILEGTVNDQYQKARAEKLAGAYGCKVVNLLEITRPIQVKIETKIVEINKDNVKDFGIKWGNNPATDPGVFQIGQSQTNTREGDQRFHSFGSYADINAQIDAMVRNGSAKVLSQPNMITVSGEKANILVGGEIPIPVSADDDKITVEWKEYGIKLCVEPEVNGEGLILSKVKAEVSSIDYTNPRAMIDIGKGLIIPSLKTRKAETVITMGSGQTMAIGGLISSEDGKTITKFPILGDLPIIGKLFTSTSFLSGKTEIVIFMTPTLVKPEEYVPAMSVGMKEMVEQNAWSDKKNDNVQSKK